MSAEHEAEVGRKTTELFGSLAERTKDLTAIDAATILAGAVGAWLDLQTERMGDEQAADYISAFAAVAMNVMSSIAAARVAAANENATKH